MRDNKAARMIARRIIFVLLILSVILISLFYIPLFPSITREKVTNGKITFIDFNANPVTGTIRISGTGIPDGQHENINSIIWSEVPNAIIEYNVIDKKGLSITFRIDENSPSGIVMLGAYGQDEPYSIDIPAPGEIINYVEIRTINVSYSDADVTFLYRDDSISNISENNLTIYIFDPGAKEWKELPTRIDTDNNSISATVDVMSVFALGPHISGIPAYVIDKSAKNISEQERLETSNLTVEELLSGYIFTDIEVQDSRNKSIRARIRSIDGIMNPGKEANKDIMSESGILNNTEVEVDALLSKNIKIRFNMRKGDKGKITMDDYGSNNPVSVSLPGKPVKYVEIGTGSMNISGVEVTIKYSHEEIKGMNEDNLGIFHWNGKIWEPLFTAVDTLNNTLTANSDSLSPFGVSETVVYRWTQNTGTTVATGVTTNWASCGSEPGTYSISRLTNASTSGCNLDRQDGIVRDPAVDLFFNYNYTVNMKVNGNWYYGRLRDGGSGGGTFTFKLIYIYNNGTIVALPGSGSKTLTSGQSGFFNVSLAGISGTVPAGTKLGLRISKSGSSSDLRVYFGDSVGTGVKSGYFSMTDSAAANFYSLSGYVFNQSSGLPLSGATVTTDTSISNTTDANGFYFLSLVNGTYSVTTSLANYDSNSSTQIISGVNVNNANISLTPMPAYQVSGYVVNKSSYEFLSGANITTDTGLDAITDANGYYIFYATNGTHIVNAKKTGYGTESITITVAGETLYNINFELVPVAKIIVAVNRYVINDDPISNGKIAQSDSSFSLPYSGSSSWILDEWTGNQTKITGYALLLDQYGAPISNTSVSFTFRNWNNSAFTILPGTDTDSNGIASVTYDMDGLDYYGNWYVDANVSDKINTTGFIYNWWGCNSGGCRNHASNSAGAATSSKQNSPYTLGRESIISNSNHGTAQNDANCVGCHRSYGGTGGGANFAGQPTKTSDVHITNTCATCHAGYSTHGTNQPVKSCGDCHNRTDLSRKNTTSGTPPVSNYSGSVAATGHNYNLTIPCIICHGPMHNISKPDRSVRFTINNDTEPGHCMTCHTSYQRHNNSVNCTLCHSDDIHVVQIFDQNASYAALNKANPNTNRGNCTNCHQNSTFYTALKSNVKAGLQTGNNPVFIGNSLEHSDDHLAGGKYDNYWTPLNSYSACKFCHSNPQHSTNALGPPASFKGTNTINSTIGNTSWCLSCHYPDYLNYSDMVSSYVVVPPSIIKNSNYFMGGRDHSSMSYFNDTACYLCHNGSHSYTTMNQFMHGVYVGGGGPDCLGCHDTGKSETYMHVNNTAMKLSFHANLNNQSANSSNVSADNKKCWGCHQSDGSQPAGDSMGDKYTKPYTCDECHLITATPYANVSNAHRVTNHIWVDSPSTKIVTHNATCSACHNNSITIPYITDPRTISIEENVSHYGNLANLIDSVGDYQPSQGCVYCHLNNSNRNIWGMATDPRLSVALPHTQTTNEQCYVCHIETLAPVDNLHNSSMFYAGGGKVIFATDKYVVLDDPKIAGAKADTFNGFRLPYLDYPNWNYWSGKNTRINVAALYFNRYGVPVSGSVVNFTMFFPNGSIYTTNANTTDVNGQANFSYDMNGANYYGIWKIMASTQISSITVRQNITFIYNWWGCSFNSGLCNENHGGKNPGSRGTTVANSPYLSGRDPLTGIGDHSGTYNCTFCHQSYDGTPGGTNPVTNDPVHLNKPADVHRNLTCDNPSCHGTKTTHNTNQLIFSCYTANCHNRTDISGKSTLSSATVSTATSLYSENFAASPSARYHTPNSTVPCFVCHGPMHAINKPDSTFRFVKNNETESSHCTTCHMDYVKHNRSVNCPVCHSDDVHAIKIFAQNASFITLNHDDPNPARGNCTNCHQDASFFSSLLSQPGAGNHAGNSPAQVSVPSEHSEDTSAGQKWNQTPGYWTNSLQVTWCNYCHTSEVHSSNILGRVSLFKGNNTVNSTISVNSSWCSSCHWQNYTNGTATYSDMSGTFIAANLLVPPEISKHALYGANESNSAYYNHTDFLTDDLTCKGCHGSRIASNATITGLMHNVSTGTRGGPNCIGCHEYGVSGLAPLNKRINATSMRSGMHKNLNSNASNSTALDSLNKACWACHGNGTEPVEHPSNYSNPWTCLACHNGTTTFNSSNATVQNDITRKKTYEHIQGPYFEDINSTVRNSTVTCYFCHNKSKVNYTDSVTPTDTLSANVSHYANTSNLISPTINCSLCHKSAANSTAWLANLTRHPAKTQDVSFCANCHNSTNATDLHSRPLAQRISIHGGGGGHSGLSAVGGFDWEKDDFNETGLDTSNEACVACHGAYTCVPCHPLPDYPVVPPLLCENCHLPNTTSLFTGPYENGLYTLRSDINDTLPRVYAHTNYSNITNVTVPAQKGDNDHYPTTCYSYYTSGGNVVSCHGASYASRSNFGGYYAQKANDDMTPGNPAHRTQTIDRMPNTTNCLFCHNQTSATIQAGWAGPMQVNASNMFGNRYAVNNTSCYTCHTKNSTKPSDFHSNELVKGGGPGCLGCHNNSYPQNFSAKDGTPMHYIDGANFSRSVHVNLNSNNASGYGINASCWACHSSSGTMVANNTHPDRRDTPLTCSDCHLSSGSRAGAYNATFIYNHYKNGTSIRAPGNSPSDIASCIGCHDNVPGMITPNNDSDTGSFATDGAGVKGGNTSFYHYGANRSNFNKTAGSYDYCIYCHRNETGEFSIVFQDAANKSISNHSLRYNSSNPSCSISDCHNSTNSTLHGIQIKKPNINITLHNSSYCLDCHGMNATGNGTNYTGAVTVYKEKHNNSVTCTECHTGANKKNIHPMTYLQPNGSFATNNQTGINCTDCHQKTALDSLLLLSPPKLPDPMHHGDNISSGTVWNSTGYWISNSTITSCIYCHNDTKHNTTALGKPANWKGNNVVNESINTSSWCSSCHYRSYSSGGKNYTDMTLVFTSINLPVPPEITNGTYAPFNFSRYYNHSLTNYSDATCVLCHGNNISSNAGISAFLHNITWGSCTSCHYSFDAMNSTNHPERFVDSDMYNASLHRTLACENCHTQGHRNMGYRKACEDCHVVQENPITDKDRHKITRTPSTNMYGGDSVVNITDCTICHNAALINNSRNTYGYGKAKDCDSCHTYSDKYYN